MNKKYELTDDHRKELKPWADKWIANALSTKPMNDEEKAICRKAVKEMYKAANLVPPSDNRIVFVPSPFVLKFAGGFSSAIWHLRKNKSTDTGAATYAAIDAVTRDAIYAATEDAAYTATRIATYAATYEAAREATHAATEDATYAATRTATYAATYDAAREATHDATYAATYTATRDATRETTHDATHAATYAATYAATRETTREATHAATYTATRDATRDATHDATYAATYTATYDATHEATHDATYAATRDATRDATREATHEATHDATYAATRDATEDATRTATDENKKWYNFDTNKMKKLSEFLKLGTFGIDYSCKMYNLWNGGNQWSGWVSYLSFFRYIAKLSIDYSKFDSYEKLVIHSGPRIMHKEFCMISDRPIILKLNTKNQGHCFDGPYCKWSDGSSLFMFNGIKVYKWMAELPANKFTKEMIISEKNADIRREMIRKIGMDRIAELLEYKVIDNFDGYELIVFDMGDKTNRPWLKMNNPSMNGVVHIEGVHPDCKTVKEAICFRNGLKEYTKPIKLS